jgi:integrase/recombinase XerD
MTKSIFQGWQKMNQKPLVFSDLDEHIEGFFLYKIAEGLSPATIVSYKRTMFLLSTFLEKEKTDQIQPKILIAFMNWLRNEYVPSRFSGKKDPLSEKTLRNHWVALKSFFRWLEIDLEINNLMAKVPSPKPKNSPIEPLKKEEIEMLLKAARNTRMAATTKRTSFSMRRPTALRDVSLILMLLDTGLRAGELIALNIEGVDLSTGKVIIKHGPPGGAKGKIGRILFIGVRTRKALWKYLRSRGKDLDAREPLFVSIHDRRMTSNGLRLIIKSLAKKAGIKSCYPHLLRHTFAITFLRGGGDIFTLQQFLGHQSLEMVRRYALIAEIDLQSAHRRASPVDNWLL